VARARHIVVGVHDFSRRGWSGILEVERSSFDNGLAWNRDNYEAALEDGATCVSADDGEIRGVCWILRSEIFSLAVDPGARQRGIGKRLLRYAMRRQRRAGIKKAKLHVEPKSIPAIRLYISMGFKPVTYEPDHHGSGKGALLMMRKL
jgi:ribosomal-protein-alanine N-acetyltransferase